jgi:hypothetical protein
MQLESRVENLLNPCKFGDNLRQAVYVTANPSTITAGGDTLIRLNNNECADLSNSYIDFEIAPSGQIAETPLQIEWISGAVPTAGSWSILFNGLQIAVFDKNTTSTQVVAAFNAFPPFHSQGFTAALGAGMGGAEVVSAGIIVAFSTSGFYGLPISPSQYSNTTALVNAGVVVALNQIITASYVAPTPRLEKTLPIIREITVILGSENVLSLTNSNKLMSALSFVDTELDTQGKYLETAYQEYGLYVSRMKCRLDMSFIDLFNSVLPLELLGNRELQINIQLEQANRALICSTASNSAGQSFTLNNIRFQYHRLVLSENDKAAIRSAISGRGLVIPFKNWRNYTQNYQNGQATMRMQFNPQRKHLLGVYFLMLSTPYAQDATNVRKTSTFLRNNLQRYRLEVGNENFPLNFIECANTYQALTEQVRNLVEFTEIVKEKRLWCDLEAFSNLSGVSYLGNDPTDVRYAPYFGAPVHMNCIFGISTTDIPYSDKSSLCGRKVLEGVDSSNITNVAIVIENMSPIADGEMQVYTYSQEFLHFKDGQMRWIF